MNRCSCFHKKSRPNWAARSLSLVVWIFKLVYLDFMVSSVSSFSYFYFHTLSK